MAQMCHRKKGHDICPLHPGQKVILQCEDCPGTLVCPLCMTSDHKRHACKAINDGFTQKVEKIKSFIRKTEKQTIPQVIQEAQRTEQELKDNKTRCHQEIKKLEDQYDRIITEAKRAKAKLISELEAVFKANEQIWLKYQSTLADLQTELESIVKESKTVMASENDILIYDTEHEISDREDKAIANRPRSHMPAFIPQKDIDPFVTKAFGELTGVREQIAMPYEGLKHASELDLLEKPIVLNQTGIKYSIFCNNLCYVPCGSAKEMTWILDTSLRLHLVDQTCHQQSELKPDVPIEFISVHPITGELYGSCSLRKDVRKIDTGTGKTTEQFTIDNKIRSIACTEDSNILAYVHNTKEIRLYTLRGDLLKRYKCNEALTSVCHETKKIALADFLTGVVVLDSSLKELYTYRGQGEQSKQPFQCWTAVFHNKYLLVGDYSNCEVHVLDGKTGTFLQTIKSDNFSNVRALCVLQNNVLLVGCDDPDKLVYLKYTK